MKGGGLWPGEVTPLAQVVGHQDLWKLGFESQESIQSSWNFLSILFTIITKILSTPMFTSIENSLRELLRNGNFRQKKYLVAEEIRHLALHSGFPLVKYFILALRYLAATFVSIWPVALYSGPAVSTQGRSWLSFFLSSVANTQLNHWNKWVVSTRLTA